MGCSAAGPRLLWSVKAARGSLRSIVAIPGSIGGGTGAALQLGRAGGSALLATAGADGAVRVWRGADGRLLQSIEGAHFRWVDLEASQNSWLCTCQCTAGPIRMEWNG